MSDQLSVPERRSHVPEPGELRPLGRTQLLVTPICIGAGPLGSVPTHYGYDVSAETGTLTALRALQGPFNFIDTSANYSNGDSERRIGAALEQLGGVPDGFVLATKVDADPETGDFSAAQVRRSIEGSLERLGVDSVPLLHMHDPEKTIGFHDAVLPGGPVEELVRIRDEGLAQYIGVAGGTVAVMREFVRTGMFDVLLTHNRWTLVDQSAGDLIDHAHALGVGVVNAAPFNSGVLAKGPESYAVYLYREAEPEMITRIRQMSDACAAAGVPLAAAALQFSMRDPRVVSTVVGASKPDRIDAAERLASVAIPEDLWAVLQGFVSPAETWLW